MKRKGGSESYFVGRTDTPSVLSGPHATKADGQVGLSYDGLIAGKALCNTTGYRYFELLMLVGLHHEQNPKDEADQANEAVKRPPNPKRAKSAPEHHPRPEYNRKGNVDDMQPAKHNHRLRRVKPHEWALVN